MRCQIMIRNEQGYEDQCDKKSHLIIDADSIHSIFICKDCVARKRVHISRLSDISYKLEITTQQRKAQRTKIDAAVELLEEAALETYTCTPGEIAQTVDAALEIIAGVNEFLKSRPSEGPIEGSDLPETVYRSLTKPDAPERVKE